MKYQGFCLLSLFALLVACQPAQDPHVETWKPLFNGENLAGWTPKFTGYPTGENWRNTFKVMDSTLLVDYTEHDTFAGNFGHLFYAPEDFGYYKIRAVYRFEGAQVEKGPGWAFRNNGLMLHCQSPQSMGLEQDFPVSVEVQLLGADSTHSRSTANLCTPGTSVTMNGNIHRPHCINSSSADFLGDQWVTVTVEVYGDSLFRHLVNGEEVMTYSLPYFDGGAIASFDSSLYRAGQPIKRGYIAIQAESHPTRFKSIEVLPLEGCMDPQALNYKAYYVKSRPESCQYSD
ncbi:MAG: DUF1080 domain-containing protein [Bacteroidota bacterium]